MSDLACHSSDPKRPQETLEAHANTIFEEAENRLHVQKAILNWAVS